MSARDTVEMTSEVNYSITREVCVGKRGGVWVFLCRSSRESGDGMNSWWEGRDSRGNLHS